MGLWSGSKDSERKGEDIDKYLEHESQRAGWEVWLTVCCLQDKAEHPERQIWGLSKGDGCGSKVMISLLLQVFKQNVKQLQWDVHLAFTNSN